MVWPVALVEQWRRIEQELPERWTDARLELTVDLEPLAGRAAAILGPARAGRSGNVIRFFASRRGDGAGPDGIRRLLRRLDREGISGDLALAAASEAEAVLDTRRPLAAAWDALVAGLPEDWTDALAEIRFVSGGDLERAALLLAPLNPARYDDSPAFRFRVARRFGYGASDKMTRRCLERLDEEGVRGDVRIQRALSDTDPVATQGPVWYVGGRAV